MLNNVISILGSYWWVIAAIIAVFSYKFILRVFFGMVIVPDDKIGLVTKNFVLFGANAQLPENRIIATKGEAGMQAQTLAPGLYWGYWIWQYQISMQVFVTIPQGSIGVVSVRDGAPLSSGRILADSVASDNYQDAMKFLSNGGQKGPQAACLTAGSYRINTLLFEIKVVSATTIRDGKVGIITILDGSPLPKGHIAGKPVPGHSNFQNPNAFIANGGEKGLQEDVILAGTYFLNPWFAIVEEVPLTEVPIGYVGVVNSFVGEAGADTSGESFKHGNIVANGSKGVWSQPFDPGKYPVNPHTHKVELVPTTNIVLNWAAARTEAHNLDANLSTITVRSSDGNTFNLDVSQIIHIPASEAPKVIARFGNMQNLVSQVLEPTIGNYFRNSAQKSDVIVFLSERSERQGEAKEHIRQVLEKYNVTAVDTLIGDITPPEELMRTLTDRKLAEQMRITFDTQKLAEDTRKTFMSAKVDADMQEKVMSAVRQVEISEKEADALIKKAEGEAKAKKLNAEADAEVTTVTGKATAEITLLQGNAEAKVIKEKTEAMGQDEYAKVQIAKYLAENGIALVPQISGGNGSGDSGLMGALLGAKILEDSLNKTSKERKPVVDPATETPQA